MAAPALDWKDICLEQKHQLDMESTAVAATSGRNLPTIHPPPLTIGFSLLVQNVCPPQRQSRGGVVVICATNFPESLDKAGRRAGLMSGRSDVTRQAGIAEVRRHGAERSDVTTDAAEVRAPLVSNEWITLNLLEIGFPFMLSNR